jgi:hypothetical protein
MPEPGLSLVGLMPEDVAQHYLNRCCFLPNKSVKSIRKYWSDAKGTIGPPTARAGLPDIQEMGSEHDQYLDRVRANPAFVKALEGMPYSFKWVEIDPLLCFQFHLETNRSANLCKSVDDGPTVDDMLPICLPEHLEEIPYDVMEAGNGKLRVRAESLNLRPCLQGDISTLLADNPNKIKAAGIAFGPAAPFSRWSAFGESPTSRTVCTEPTGSESPVRLTCRACSWRLETIGRLRFSRG